MKAIHLTKFDSDFAIKVMNADFVALDTETISLTDKTMVGFSFSLGDKFSYYVPVRDEVLENMPIADAVYWLQQIIDSCIIIYHNSSFDIPVLRKFGVKFNNTPKIHDTVILANLIDETTRHGLKFLVKKYFDYGMIEFKEICGTGKKQIPFSQVEDAEKKLLYACDDAYWALRLFKTLMSFLNDEPKLLKLYEEIEQPLLKVVADMRINGINIDVKKVKEIAEACRSHVELAETKLKTLIGDINFNSPKQLKKYFIDELHMPQIKVSEKTGAPSMDKETLKIYAETNDTAKLLLEYRKYAKVLSTFIPALTPANWDIDTWKGRIYPSFNQAGTISGRFSSSKPNMQNIPRKDELGIRQAVVSDKGHILIGADYSQIELRVLAHFSQDANLLEAYQGSKKNIHQQTADACNIEYQKAKTMNFSMAYGIRSKALAKQLEVSQEEAQQYIDKYFEMYPGIVKFWKDSENTIRGQGFIETLFGRKRRCSKYFHVKDNFDQGKEIRSITNAVVQGTAADLMKAAMVSMHPQLKQLGARIISTVHDEIIVSCPVSKAKRAFAIVHRSMVEAGIDLSVPIEVDCKFGRTWEEAHGDGIGLEKINA